MTCNICLKEYKNIIKITTTCKHTFCLDCLSKLNNCPYCRKILNVKNYFKQTELNTPVSYSINNIFEEVDFYYTSIRF